MNFTIRTGKISIRLWSRNIFTGIYFFINVLLIASMNILLFAIKWGHEREKTLLYGNM